MENVLETSVILCGVHMWVFLQMHYAKFIMQCNVRMALIPVGLHVRTRHHGLSKRVIKQHSCSWQFVYKK